VIIFRHLTTDDLGVTGPAGEIAPADIVAVGGNEYHVLFPAQTERGTYTFTVGPDITDLSGTPMDQDEDGSPGEPIQDVFTFTVDAIDADTVFTTDVGISAGDTTYDGQDICILGATLTVDGAHGFHSVQAIQSGVITHTAGSVAAMNLTVVEDVILDVSGALSVDGKGYASGSGLGAGEELQYQSGYSHYRYGGGGGYGGVGQDYSGSAGGGLTYGSLTEPTDLGSGGGFGGAGGGLVRLSVGGELRVDGHISANGDAGSSGGLGRYFGGGSGGSIWITAATFSGSGLIAANGGEANTGRAGGGQCHFQLAF
jgi:hypothetical protein